MENINRNKKRRESTDYVTKLLKQLFFRKSFLVGFGRERERVRWNLTDIGDKLKCIRLQIYVVKCRNLES